MENDFLDFSPVFAYFAFAKIFFALYQTPTFIEFFEISVKYSLDFYEQPLHNLPLLMPKYQNAEVL